MCSQRLRNIGISLAGNVVSHRDARKLDDAAFDGVHQREVAHRPREQRAFGIAGTAKEEWRCREIHDALDPELAVDGFKAGNPKPAASLFFSASFFSSPFRSVFIGISGLFSIAVMRLIIEHEDVLQAHQVGHDPLDHLPFGFQCVQLLAAALEEVNARPSTAPCARGA